MVAETYSGGRDILCHVFCFVCLRLVCPMLPVSLDCPVLIIPSIFSNVYLEQKGYEHVLPVHNDTNLFTMLHCSV